jgi:SpoVK/Ycf46/Vps4 family AAA+-type ATPase
MMVRISRAGQTGHLLSHYWTAECRQVTCMLIYGVSGAGKSMLRKSPSAEAAAI